MLMPLSRPYRGNQQRDKRAIRREAAAASRLVENAKLLKKPSRLRAPASEAHFRLFVPAIEGLTAEIGTSNAINLESLGREFVELGRRVGEFYCSTHTSRSPSASRRCWTCGGE
jgi:hypothetical protein